MPLIGCTGGIGSGKSVVCARLASHGATVIDVDEIARGLSARGSAAFSPTVEAFGEEILGADGEIDRASLAEIVFNDVDLRRRLEEIVHPLVEAEIRIRIAQAHEEDVVVLDHPLLVETDARKRFSLDGVLVVDTPEGTAIERLVTYRGMRIEDARARVAAQCSREARRNIADFIVLNIGTIDELVIMADRAFAWIATLKDA